MKKAWKNPKVRIATIVGIVVLLTVLLVPITMSRRSQAKEDLEPSIIVAMGEETLELTPITVVKGELQRWKTADGREFCLYKTEHLVLIPALDQQSTIETAQFSVCYDKLPDRCTAEAPVQNTPCAETQGKCAE